MAVGGDVVQGRGGGLVAQHALDVDGGGGVVAIVLYTDSRNMTGGGGLDRDDTGAESGGEDGCSASHTTMPMAVRVTTAPMAAISH